jgi:hypothetical protein
LPLCPTWRSRDQVLVWLHQLLVWLRHGLVRLVAIRSTEVDWILLVSWTARLQTVLL